MSMNPAGARFKQSASVTGTTITKPTLTVHGDLMVVLAASTTAYPTAPAGWTQLGADAFLFSGYSRCFYKVHGDEAGTTTYAFTNASAVFMLTFAGVDVASPIGWIGAWETESATITPTYSGVTTYSPGAMAVAWCTVSTTPTYTAPSGWTEGLDATGVEGVYQLRATPGSTGSFDFVPSISGNAVMIGFEVRASAVSRRFYLDSAAAGIVTPGSWCAQWDLNTASAVLRRLNDIRGSSALTFRTFVDNSATNNQDSALMRHVISLGTGRMEGGFQAMLQAYESSTSANAFAQISIKIIKPDLSDRAVLYAGHTNTGTTGSEFAGTTQSAAANRYFPKPTLSHTLVAADHYQGDFLVVEIGFRQNSTGTTYTAGMYHGEPSTTDIPDNAESGTTDYTPWIEFASGVVLSGEGPEFRPVAYRQAA